MSLAAQRRTAQTSAPARWRGQRIERTSLAGRVYERLRAALMMGDLKPGERLHCRAIAQEFGVSQTPVREALLRLVAERSLSVNPSTGAVTVPRLTGREYGELCEVRVALEGLACRLAATNVTPENLSELECLNRKMIATEKEGHSRAAVRLHYDFHFGVYRMSGRHELVALIESLWTRTGPYVTVSYEDVSSQPVGALPNPHENIIAALRLRDGMKAADCIADHLVTFGDAIRAALERSETRSGTPRRRKAT